MNDEWNNENSAISVFGIAIAVCAIVAVIAIVLAALATPAHAAALEPHAPDKPLGEGGLEALGISSCLSSSCAGWRGT